MTADHPTREERHAGLTYDEREALRAWYFGDQFDDIGLIATVERILAARATHPRPTPATLRDDIQELLWGDANLVGAIGEAVLDGLVEWVADREHPVSHGGQQAPEVNNETRDEVAAQVAEAVEETLDECCGVPEQLRDVWAANADRLDVPMDYPATLALLAERDALAEKVARVEALADEWKREAEPYLIGGARHNIATDTLFARADCRWVDAERLRAALGGTP